jgi:hypothetical protein
MGASTARADVFIDGANLYASLKASGVWANRIDPNKVARKLVESRTLVEVRYYIAEIDRTAPVRVYRAFGHPNNAHGVETGALVRAVRRNAT